MPASESASFLTHRAKEACFSHSKILQGLFVALGVCNGSRLAYMESFIRLIEPPGHCPARAASCGDLVALLLAASQISSTLELSLSALNRLRFQLLFCWVFRSHSSLVNHWHC